MEDADEILIIANDKFNLCPKIAKENGPNIGHLYLCPVLARSEGDRYLYTEKIFCMKKGKRVHGITLNLLPLLLTFLVIIIRAQDFCSNQSLHHDFFFLRCMY